MKRITAVIATILGSRRFLYGVLVLFGLEAVWVAASSVYPMAFDEDFHLGIIKIYAHHWLPFLSGQPDGANAFGAVARDPSYLYHYLMSFPYRLLTHLTGSETAQIIVLRLINAALFGTGLALFYKVLRRAGGSRIFANTALALFVLVPIVPQLAGQINYDNLFLPLVAGLCLLTFRLHGQLRARSIDVRTVAWFLALCLLATLVKYAFLPLDVAAVAFLAGTGLRAFRHRSPEFKQAAAAGWAALGGRVRVGLVVLLVVSVGLFVQRYGVNLVRYHTPTPECDAVLNEDDCEAYGPWARNHQFAQTKGSISNDPFSYAWTWLLGMHYRTFFVVNGPASDYANYPPLPVPAATAIVIGVSGAVAVLFYWRRVFGPNPLLIFLLLLVLSYCLVLWGEDYSQFLETGQPVAINGRYLLPMLLPVAAVWGRALGVALHRSRSITLFAALAAILLFLQGGGALSFILRSDPTWYWPNHTVIQANSGMRRLFAPLVIEGDKYY